jgi:hypothetical protein
MSLRTVTMALLLAGALWAPVAGAQSPPGDGPGGPIAVVTDSSNPFGRYYAEILRAEGLNEFDVTSTQDLAATLASHQVVLLATTSVDATQASQLATWVTNGGNLIAMRPNQQLASLLGLGADGGDLTNGYVGVATGSPPGAGITADTMQFHGTADRRPVTTATRVATLYDDADSATSGAAVSLRSVGTAGGQAAAFTYDLARSVVYTRQGNPAAAGLELDGHEDVIRSDDLFFPSWLDFDKVAIPQADEQQRLLANLITQMTLDRGTPLPRFWYLPRDAKAAVVMTGDDHGVAGTKGQFDRFEAESPAGCSIPDWQCIRSTSYIYNGTSISDEEAADYQAAGFEIGLHLSTACADFTAASLEENWATQLPEFLGLWPSLAPQRTNRTHCIPWSDWAGEPKAELRHGVRFDTNYYYWPGDWVMHRPGMFTGSGFPMRFADVDGSLIDVYQAATQITDESDINYETDEMKLFIDALLDRALNDGYYGVFTANMHTDQSDHPGANTIVAEAKLRHVPVVSAVQMLDWLDGRNGSSFQGLSFSGGELHFTVAAAPGSTGLRAMVPVNAAAGQLQKLTRNGAVANVTRRTVKGIDYAFFDAAAGGNFVASYGPGDSTPPETTIGDATVGDGSAQITFSSNEAGWFECRLDGGAFGACASPAVYSGLADGSHTFSVRAIDTAGNVDPTPASRDFATTGGAAAGGTTTGAGTTGAGGGSTPGGGQSTGQGATSAVDRSGPRVTIVKRTVRASAKGVVTLRIACPRAELRCRVDLRLRRGGRQLVGKTLTVPGGKAVNVTLRLLRSDRLRLVRVRSLLVDAAATGRDVAGNRATTTTRIRILAPARRAGPVR